jgi:uncharacterized YceG family protein
VSPVGNDESAARRTEAEREAAWRNRQQQRHERTRRGRGRLVALLASVALAVVVVWFLLSLFQPFHGDGSGRVSVVVPQGASAKRVGDLLEREGVVSSSFFFDLRTRLAGKRGDLRAGTYTLAKDMSYGDAIAQLTTAPATPPVRRVTIPEGPSRREVAAIASQAGVPGDYVAASASSPALRPSSYGAPKGTRTLEGFLFPATYELRREAPASALVSDQLTAFRRNFATVSLKRAKRKNLTAYDVLIIASMIEREAGVARDRRLIAAVIYNRLKAGMALGIDATLRYELDNWTQPLKASELAADTPFNTRRRMGLPPTPIGNPGLASIRAAANPANVPYLYYVVKPCANGAHAFSSTDAQFQRDVEAYNRARAKAGGNSPVNC